MKKLTEKLENTYMAAAFAEAGEHNTAVQIAGLHATGEKKRFSIFQPLEKMFNAITFAEAGCPELALEFVRTEPAQSGRKSFETFLDATGLRGVQFTYGVVRV